MLYKLQFNIPLTQFLATLSKVIFSVFVSIFSLVNKPVTKINRHLKHKRFRYF
jgi:hypothetical protein